MDMFLIEDKKISKITDFSSKTKLTSRKQDETTEF